MLRKESGVADLLANSWQVQFDTFAVDMNGSYRYQVLIPVYNEADNLMTNMRELVMFFDNNCINFNLLIIDDGSSDGTFDVIKRLKIKDDRISCKRLVKSYGKDYAIMSCMCCNDIDYYLVLDSDMQLSTDDMKKMIELAELDPSIEIVSAIRATRYFGSVFYRIATEVFYFLVKAISGDNYRLTTDYKLVSSQCGKLIYSKFVSRQLYFRGVCEQLPVKHISMEVMLKRSERKTRFSIWRYFQLIKNILFFSYIQRGVKNGNR